MGWFFSSKSKKKTFVTTGFSATGLITSPERVRSVNAKNVAGHNSGLNI